MGRLISILLVIGFFSFVGFAQEGIKITNLSKRFDVELRPAGSESNVWKGKLRILISRKGSSKSFQVIEQKTGYIAENPVFTNTADKRNGKWSDLYLEDLNFDGVEDLAVPDGRDGGYGGISYRVYLFDKSLNRFLYSAALTRLAHGPYIGIFEPNFENKTLSVFSKSGCCTHYRETYKLRNGRPRLIETTDEYYDPPSDKGYIVIETRKLVGARWRTWTKRTKITANN